MKLAMRADAASTRATANNVGASQLAVPKSNFRIKVAAPTEQKRPAKIPAPTSQPASFKIIQYTPTL